MALISIRAEGIAGDPSLSFGFSAGGPLDAKAWRLPTLVAVRLALPAQFADYRLDLVRGDPGASAIEVPYFAVSSMAEAVALPKLPGAPTVQEYKQIMAWPGYPLPDECGQRWDTARWRLTVDLNGFAQLWPFFLEFLIVEGHHDSRPAGGCADGECPAP